MIFRINFPVFFQKKTCLKNLARWILAPITAKASGATPANRALGPKLAPYSATEAPAGPSNADALSLPPSPAPVAFAPVGSYWPEYDGYSPKMHCEMCLYYRYFRDY